MDCVYGFASSISRDLVCGAINQLRYPCCFNNFVIELAKEEDNLSATIKSVEDRIEHAQKQTRKTADVIGKWLKEANVDKDNVNQLLVKAKENKSCCFGQFPNWVWRYSLGKKLANKKRDIEKYIGEGKQYIQLARVASLPLGLLDFSSEKCLNFESRQSNYKQLMEALKDDGVAMIGLYGMGGCGKTTLAMEARKVAEAEHLFDKVFFVPVSSTVDVRKIQEKIASSIGYGFPENEKEENERAQRLLMRLMQERKILVILDDVWQKIDLGAIGIPSVEHHKGCKVLITTRSKNVCTLMDCQQNIQLQILKDEEAWVLFQKLAHISEDTSDVLKHLAREISKECKGLPVAIAAVASTLKGKAEVIWKAALKKLRASKPINIEKGLINPYMCLKLSYDHLDTEESRSIFLLCSVFPEDSEIPIEILTRCVIGLGLVGEVHSYEEARWEVIEAKIKLVSSCLLLNADDECVKMHDLVRDVAHLVAKNENKIIICELEKDVILEQNSLSYLCCEKFPNNLDCSNLEFLFIPTELEVSGEIFKKMGNLRVLILVNEGIDKLPLSTMSFKSLTNLRCLILFNWKLNNISFVRYMKEFQSLSLNNCSLHSLIELQSDDAVTQPTNWKFLEVRQCQMDIHNFEFLYKIPQLEELSIIDNLVNGNENIIEFFKTFSIPQTVDSYEIKIGLEDDDGDDDDFFSSFSHKRTLMLGHFPISNEAIKGLAKKTKVLLMKNILGDANNVIPDIFQVKEGDLNELNELHIGCSEGIEYLVDTSNHLSKVEILFSKLLVLRLYCMDHLKVLWHGYIPPSKPFQNLEKLCVYNCPKLTFLFTCGIARCLVQLKELEIFECVELKHILADDDTTEKSLDEFKANLHVQSAIFLKLQKVRVSQCLVLKYVFPASIIRGLPQLKMMSIEYCAQLHQIIEDIVPPTPVMSYSFAHKDQKQELVEIIEDEQCQHNFPQVEANQSKNFSKNTSILSAPFVENNSGSFILSSLTTVELTSCPKLNSLFTKSTAETLTSLEELTIRNCPGLKHIVTCERTHNNKKRNIVRGDHDIQSDISIFKSLKRLIIESWEPLSFFGDSNDEKEKESPDLEYLFCHQNNFEDNSYYLLQKSIQIGQVSLELKKLELNNLPKMTYIWVASKNYFSLPNLEALTIRRCAKLKVTFPSSILRCLPNLERLEIFECDELKQIMEEDKELSSTQPCFPKLESLVVEECHKLKSLFYVSSPTDFSNLEVLSIGGVTELEKLFGCKEGASKNSFSLPSLKTLEISRCTKLEVIFPAFVLRWLPNLELLKIKECDELKHIMEEDKKLSSTQPCFPKLASLFVIECHKLKSLFYVSSPIDFSNLEDLTIDGATELEKLFGCKEGASKNSFSLPSLKTLETSSCTKLEVIFPAFVLTCLPKLERLRIFGCDELKQIMEEDKELSSTQPCFPKLVALAVIECHKLKSLFYVSSPTDFPNLEVMYIKGATELEKLFGCKEGAYKNSFSLASLKRIETSRCTKLEVIFPAFVLRCLPNLEQLKIKECKELKHIMEEVAKDKNLSNLLSAHPCFPKLASMVVKECPKLKNFFSVSDDIPNLELLIISEAAELETLFEKAKVELSSLKLLIFVHLSNLCQGTELLTVKHRIVQDCPKLSLTSTTSLSELNENFDYSDIRITKEATYYLKEEIDDLICTSSVRELPSSQNTIPRFRNKNHSLLPLKWLKNTEDIRKEIIQEWPVSEGPAIKSTSTSVEGIALGGGAVTHTESTGEDILAQDFQVIVKQEKPNEGNTETMQCQETQILEGLSTMEKQDGKNIVSNSNIKISPASADTRPRLGSYKHFVDLDDVQIALLVEAIAAYPHLWNACEKFSERFQAWMLKTLADMLLFLRSGSVNSLTPQGEKEFHKLCDEAVELGFDRSWVDEMRQSVVVGHPELEKYQTQARMDELCTGSSGADIVPDSQAVEQGDRQIEYRRGTSPSQKIQNVDNSIQEGSHLIGKKGEIGVVSDERIVPPRNEEVEIEFVSKVFTSDISTIATSSTNSEPVERPSPSCLDIPQDKTHPNGLVVDRQPMSEPCLMNQPKPLGEISETRSSQTETCSTKEGADHHKTIQEFGANDMMSLVQPVAVEADVEGQVTKHHSTKDNRVVKALVDIEKCLKMPLKDIASSETNTLCLMTAFNFLSNLPFKDATLSNGVRDIIDTMHKDFPRILSSFKQGFATSDKLAVFEAHLNEAAITLVSKISEAEKLMNEAEEKEGVLRERVNRLKKEIKECEAELSCLEEEKKKCIAESKGYKKEVENVRKDKSQMVEDQSKVREQLSEVAYKWSRLCSQFQHNRITS